MKDVKKKKALVALDTLAAALTVAAGIINFAGSGDWKWICWVTIVVGLYLRLWLKLGALRRKADESETWRELYQKEADKVLDMAWQAERNREDGK